MRTSDTTDTTAAIRLVASWLHDCPMPGEAMTGALEIDRLERAYGFYLLRQPCGKTTALCESVVSAFSVVRVEV